VDSTYGPPCAEKAPRRYVRHAMIRDRNCRTQISSLTTLLRAVTLPSTENTSSVILRAVDAIATRRPR
jgi:hypothetical protein